MALGTVKWFNDAKGYGFISRADDGKDVFVHYSSITGEGFRTLAQGATVEYEESTGPKGLFAARVLKVLAHAAAALRSLRLRRGGAAHGSRATRSSSWRGEVVVGDGAALASCMAWSSPRVGDGAAAR